MEDYFIENFEKFWPDYKILFHNLDFQIIYKIVLSDKINSGNPHTVWQVMNDWMEVDTSNRLTYFKQFFINCFKFDRLPHQFVENNIYHSNIFRLLPVNFQNELKIFANKIAKKLLVCFNSKHGSIEFYDFQHKSWNSSPVSLQLPNEQCDSQFALLGSMLYAFGGMERNYNVINKMWSLDLSDPSSQWTARADMNQSREEFCSVIFNGTIYVFGGVDNNNHPLRSCERYCSQLNEWSTVADMNCDRDYASAAVINGCIYVAGGWDDIGRYLKSVCKYCPETDTWSEVAPMTTQRILFTLTPFAGRLWAIGGMGGDRHPLSSCESYDPVTDTWREEAPIKEVRFGHAAIEFNGELYVVGRWKSGDSKIVEKYVPTMGWVEDSSTNFSKYNPFLFITSRAYLPYFKNTS